MCMINTLCVCVCYVGVLCRCYAGVCRCYVGVCRCYVDDYISDTINSYLITLLIGPMITSVIVLTAI